METASLENILAEHSFCRGMSPQHLQLMSQYASIDSFNARQFIFREGEEAKHFYLVRYGRVALEIFTHDRAAITIQTIEEDEALGWSWLFWPYRWHFDAHTIELTRTIALDAAGLRAKAEEDHEFGFELMKRISFVMAERLQATRLQLLDLYGVHA